MTQFMPGLDLSEAFYHEAVAPILMSQLPNLAYSAALIGHGSEVQGFDTPRSTDHHWGPRVLLFLRDDEADSYKPQIDALLRNNLPRTFRGYSTSFGPPDAIGVRLMQPSDSGPVDHMVEIFALYRFFQESIGADPRRMTVVDWLLAPRQRLRELTGGRVFYDGLGELESLRESLRWYPRDVWLYMLAAQWTLIGQEEPFMARCGDVGDELGSRIVAARQARRLMELCFLIERQYAPYSKWLGTAFARLAGAATLGPMLEAVLAATDWREREQHLSAAYTFVAERQNALGISAPLPVEVSAFHERPYQVIHGDRFAESISAAITDEAVRALPPFVGNIDQWVDNTDALEQPRLIARLRRLYERA